MAKMTRVYGALLKTSWTTALEYRAQVVLWVISGVFPLVMMVVWLAVVDEVGPAAGWERADFISYYIGAALVNQLLFNWIVWEWDEDIRTGQLSVKLLKPVDPFHYLLSDQLGWKFFFLVTFVPLAAIAAWLVPSIRYPLTPALAVAFAGSLVLGFALGVMVSCTFGVLAFWSTQVRNLYSLWFGIGQFLSGWIAPLALFPDPFRRIANLLPFRSMLGFPLEILMGDLAWPDIAFGFAVTMFWLLVTLALYRAFWQRGLRRYEAVGA